MSTKFVSKEQGNASRSWVVFDADDQVVGRLASDIAGRLRGKHSPAFTPHVDLGDFVVVVNIDKLRFTGNKPGQKIYYNHSGYVGGLKKEKAENLLARKPEEVLRRAVKGMLPHTNLGRAQLKKLYMYTGSDHPHAAQQPQSVSLGR